MLKHYVRFYEPGFFFSESSVKEVGSRIPADLLNILPQYCFELEIWDEEVIKQNNVLCDKDIEFQADELGMNEVCESCDLRYKCATERNDKEIHGKPKNHSVKILFGDKFTVDELKARNDSTLGTLINNLEGNGYPYGVYCVTHNWQWAEENDIVIPTHADLVQLTEAI